MIVFIRRSSAVLLACIFVLNLVLLVCSGVLANNTPAANNCILLDAGHGAPDGGCVGTDGTQEAALNLAVSLKLKAALEKRGYRVLMTRADENAIYDSGESIAQKKRADMRRRKALRDESGAGLFISIHMNSFSQSQYHGAQVVYDTKNPQAQQVALCIQNAIREKADPENTRVPMAAPSSLYLMKLPQVPSVIVECGFLSNEAEREKLKTEGYQQSIADAIAEGVCIYDAKQKTGQETEGTTIELQRE